MNEHQLWHASVNCHFVNYLIMLEENCQRIWHAIFTRLKFAWNRRLQIFAVFILVKFVKRIWDFKIILQLNALISGWFQHGSAILFEVIIIKANSSDWMWNTLWCRYDWANLLNHTEEVTEKNGKTNDFGHGRKAAILTSFEGWAHPETNGVLPVSMEVGCCWEFFEKENE